MIVSVYGPRRDECHFRLLISVSIDSYDTLSGKNSPFMWDVVRQRIYHITLKKKKKDICNTKESVKIYPLCLTYVLPR